MSSSSRFFAQESSRQHFLKPVTVSSMYVCLDLLLLLLSQDLTFEFISGLNMTLNLSWAWLQISDGVNLWLSLRIHWCTLCSGGACLPWNFRLSGCVRAHYTPQGLFRMSCHFLNFALGECNQIWFCAFSSRRFPLIGVVSFDSILHQG